MPFPFLREGGEPVDLIPKSEILKQVKSEVITADDMVNELTPVHMSRDKEKAAPAIWSKPSERRTIARGRRDASPLVPNHLYSHRRI